MTAERTQGTELPEMRAEIRESQRSTTARSFDHGQSRLFRNTIALAVGRNLSALGRLVVASLVVREYGTEMFGVYSVLVALLAIADWILDFGTTDVFVREVVKSPNRYDKLRKSLVAFKLIQAPVSMFLMIAFLVAMEYPQPVLQAGIVAAVSLSFFSAVAVYRSIFNATLTMEREMVAEFFSVLLMVPLVLASFYFDLGIVGLMWSVFLSRSVFLVGCIILSKGDRSLSLSGVARNDVVWLARASFVIGVIGLLVVINNTIEIVLLSRLSEISDVAYFSAAQKLVWPIFMVLCALGTSYYPVLAAQFPRNRELFKDTCQEALDLTFILGGLAISTVYCGADFFLSLISPDLVMAAPALRVLVIVSVVKAIAAVIGPVLFIANGQRYAFRYFLSSLVVKAGAIYWVAPTYGFLGVAFVTLVVEAALITPITLFYVQRLTGYRVRASIPLRVIIATVIAVTMSGFYVPLGGMPGLALSGAIYCAIAAALRVVSIKSLRTMISQKSV